MRFDDSSRVVTPGQMVKEVAEEIARRRKRQEQLAKEREQAHYEETQAAEASRACLGW